MISGCLAVPDKVEIPSGSTAFAVPAILFVRSAVADTSSGAAAAAVVVPEEVPWNSNDAPLLVVGVVRDGYRLATADYLFHADSATGDSKRLY